MSMFKKFFLPLTIFSAVFIFTSCDDEDDPAPVESDFTLAVTGEAPNAEVTIVNNTTGASNYEWTFSEGGEVQTSSAEEPGTITVDKAGTFEVTLVASNGNRSETLTKTIQITGENAIEVYENVEFGRDSASTTYGRYFSTETGETYMQSEVNATTGPLIDLVFEHLGDPVNYFASPDDADEKFNIPGATTTKILNYPSTSGITTAMFDAANSAAFLDGVTITASDEESFGTTHPYIILFETSDGRRGVIKTKEVNGDRLVADIKVEKYESDSGL